MDNFDDDSFADCFDHGRYPVELTQCPVCLAIENEEQEELDKDVFVPERDAWRIQD